MSKVGKNIIAMPKYQDFHSNLDVILNSYIIFPIALLNSINVFIQTSSFNSNRILYLWERGLMRNIIPLISFHEKYTKKIFC